MAILVPGLKHDLETHADTENRQTQGDTVADYAVSADGAQPRHAGSICPHTGDDKAVGAHGQVRIGAELRIDPKLGEGVHHGPYVAEPIVKHLYPGHVPPCKVLCPMSIRRDPSEPIPRPRTWCARR